MRNVRLSVKLIVSFAFIILIQAVGSSIGIVILNSLDVEINELSNNWLPGIAIGSEVEKNFNAMRYWEIMCVLASNENLKEEYEKLYNTAKEAILSTARYEKDVNSAEEKQIKTEIGKSLEQYFALSEKVINLSRSKNNAEAIHLIEGESLNSYKTTKAAFNKLHKVNEQGAVSSARTGHGAFTRGRINFIVIIFSAACLSAIICILIIRDVLRQLGEDPSYLFEMTSRIAAGDLDMDFRDHKGNGGVYAVLKQMVANLKAKIEESNKKSAEALAETTKAQQAMKIAEAAKVEAETAQVQGMFQAANKLEGIVEIVTSASEELSAQIEQSSRGAEEQSRRMMETARSMDAMNDSVLEVAKNAANAADTADQAKGKAEDGARVVDTVVKGIETVRQHAQEMKLDMGALGTQAEGIGQIINVISDIADQTNLLALNAAIEAARAGDAGRGFAVVADEVRKLAEKTMSATKEVGEAIRGIQEGTRKNMALFALAVDTIIVMYHTASVRRRYGKYSIPGIACTD